MTKRARTEFEKCTLPNSDRLKCNKRESYGVLFSPTPALIEERKRARQDRRTYQTNRIKAIRSKLKHFINEFVNNSLVDNSSESEDEGLRKKEVILQFKREMLARFFDKLVDESIDKSVCWEQVTVQLGKYWEERLNDQGQDQPRHFRSNGC